LWQAFSVLNPEVNRRVDETYPAYLAEAAKAGPCKVLNRLVFMRLTSLQMFEESDAETQEMVRQRIKEDNLDMPEELAEASEAIGEEEAKRYYENYRKQV
jgi:DNA helicase TIP49 (TBP-interacting protein)